ncbi:MAG: hypothetical protein M3068_12350 [Gemmatimonadota bacterium]|nr:hypothetical protein [Gemmatimonadota bacterium]
MQQWSKASIAPRVRALIDREEAGDVEAAAHRLGISGDELASVERAFAADSLRRGVRLLAALVRAYHADACWLITGRTQLPAAELAPESRLEVANLLLDVANELLEQRARQREARATALS